MPDPFVVFHPDGRRGTFKTGTTLLHAARTLGVNINSHCGGTGKCGKCIIEIVQGKDNINQKGSAEIEILGTENIEREYRLACQVVINGDVTIIVPQESRSSTQRLQSEGLDTPVKPEPLITKHVTGDKVTIFFGNKALVDISSSNHRILGFAVDVGTTKLVGYLLDLIDGKVLAVATSMNPQIPYGEDIISRLTYGMKGVEPFNVLHNALIRGVNQLLNDACRTAGVNTDDIYESVIVGNTAMHHFFLGLELEPLTHSPFTSPNLNDRDFNAGVYGLGNPKGNIHTLPLIAGFVGADCVAAILATELHRSNEQCFLIDIGTNTEIVAGNKEKMVACSCASGPAFEGAHIKHGMRAATGAIESMWIDQDSQEPTTKTIDDAQPTGICGSGIIDALSEMLKTGIIDTSGRIRVEIDSPRVRRNRGVPEYVIAWEKDTGIKEDIVLTQLDVRELQKGKAAIFSGAQILLKRLGLEPSEIERVYMAGAFGTYIGRESAINLGMIPEFKIHKINQVGNAAGTGARMALLSSSAREEANNIASTVEYIELASQPGYGEAFMDSLYFPHRDLKLFPITVKKLFENNLILGRLHKNLKRI